MPDDVTMRDKQRVTAAAAAVSINFHQYTHTTAVPRNPNKLSQKIGMGPLNEKKKKIYTKFYFCGKD